MNHFGSHGSVICNSIKILWLLELINSAVFYKMADFIENADIYMSAKNLKTFPSTHYNYNY